MSGTLVGREHLVAQATQVLRRPGPGVVLLGDEGVGKTRVCDEVLGRLRTDGVQVVHCVATAAAATLPFGALADLLPPGLLPSPAPSDVLRAATARLRTAGARAALVVAVDDAHLLDDASAALVAHVVRTGAARTLLVVRDLAPGPDAVLGLLDGPGRTLRVEPLGEPDLARVCAEALGGPVEAATLRRLCRLAGGSLLHLHELLAAGRSDGALTAECGVWRATGTAFADRRLSHLVGARVGRLPEEVRGVVELAALAGPVEVALLEQLTSPDAVLAAERAGLLVAGDDRRRLHVRLASPLYAEVLRAGAPRLAARRHRQGLARVLAATGTRRSDDVLRLALLRLDAGEPADEQLLLTAARSATELFDVHLALRLTTAAAQGGSPAAGLARAEALAACGRADEAESLLARLRAGAVTAQDRGRVALVQVSVLLGGFGRAAEAGELVRAALEELEAGDLRDELAALGGVLSLTAGQAQRAVEQVEPLLAREGEPTRATVRALLVAMSGWGQVGRAETAVVVGEKVRDDVPEAELPAVLEGALVGLCYAYGVLGRLDDAERLAHDRYAAALDQRAPDLRTLWALALGQAALARGDLPTADAHLQEAEALLRADRSLLGVYSLAWCLGCRAETAAARGDAQGAGAALREAVAATPEPCFILPRELARVWVTWAEQSSAAAVEVALEVAGQAGARGLLAVEAFALHQAARLGRPEVAADRLAALAQQVDGPLVLAHAQHAAALAAGDPAGLLAACEAYARLGVWVDAAEAAAQGADAAARTGRRAESARAAQRSAALAARCPGARTPALVPQVDAQPLTAREREVAELAARGWATGRIAEELVVSARTVDNHLHRAYGKLGISSRRQLAELLLPPTGAARPG